MVELHPGAINSVPKDAHCEVDIRDIDGPRRNQVVAASLAAAQEISARTSSAAGRGRREERRVVCGSRGR